MRQTQLALSLISNPMSMDLEEYADVLAQLLIFGQTLCECTKNASERLCQEVKRVTQGKARLFLYGRDSSADQLSLSDSCANFPVQFGQNTYGALHVISDRTQSVRTAIPLSMAQVLAQTCGLLLHQLELATLIEGQSRRLSYQIYGRLTKREQEVLMLMYRGYTQEEMADILQVSSATISTHQKHLCQKLSVHSERDIPLAAYRARLFPVLD
jgi:DNA-binding CsgD family transcriptional regulator